MVSKVEPAETRICKGNKLVSNHPPLFCSLKKYLLNLCFMPVSSAQPLGLGCRRSWSSPAGNGPPDTAPAGPAARANELPVSAQAQEAALLTPQLPFLPMPPTWSRCGEGIYTEPSSEHPGCGVQGRLAERPGGPLAPLGWAMPVFLCLQPFRAESPSI